MSHYEILAEASGGKLTPQEVYNLETYGVKHPSEFAPEEIEVKEKDVKEWSMSDATIDKYKERYKEIWREKLDEVVKRMMDKI